MAEMGIKVDLRGPLFESGAPEAVVAGANDALNLLAMKGQGFVQAQLVKGHGVRTGHLRRSIHGGLVKSLHAQIDAGLAQQGANVFYAQMVEEGTPAHTILPRSRRALAFTVNGQRVVVRSVRHPGTRGLHMFANALRQLQALDVGRFIAQKITEKLG